jgi:hypothetical protein
VTWKPHRHLLILSCLLALAACGKDGSEADNHEAAAATEGADAIGVALDADEQEKLGVSVAPLEAAQFQGEIEGPGIVLSVQPIAQAVADVATAEAAANASAAALKRAKGLFDAGTAISAEAVEAAERQAVTDAANLALARTKASVAFGANAPWLDAKRRAAILRKLSASSAAVVQASFPAGLGDGQDSTLTIRKVGVAPGGRSWRATDVWIGPADPAVPGPTLFGYVDNAKGLAQGDHIIAAVATSETFDGVVVPASAIVIAGGAAWCYVVENSDHFVRKEVDLGRPSGSGYFQATNQADGLKPGATIVVGGAGLLLARETGGGEEED